MKPLNQRMVKLLKFGMAAHMYGEMDTQELVRQFKGAVVKCPPAVARGSQYLHKKTAHALPMNSKLWA